MRIGLLGAGFLASHIIPAVLPFFDSFLLLDRDYVEAGNYDNMVAPAGMIGRRKVLALGYFIRLLSKREVIMVHKEVRNAGDLEKVYKRFPWDVGVVTFDNVAARKVALKFSLSRGVPTIFAGVGENYAYVDWENNVILPESDEEIAEEVERIRDVCGRREFRALGALTASLVAISIQTFLATGRRVSHIASIKDGRVSVSSFTV